MSEVLATAGHSLTLPFASITRAGGQLQLRVVWRQSARVRDLEVELPPEALRIVAHAILDALDWPSPPGGR